LVDHLGKVQLVKSTYAQAQFKPGIAGRGSAPSFSMQFGGGEGAVFEAPESETVCFPPMSRSGSGPLSAPAFAFYGHVVLGAACMHLLASHADSIPDGSCPANTMEHERLDLLSKLCADMYYIHICLLCNEICLNCNT